MANAVPVHPQTPEAGADEAKAKAPKARKGGPEKVECHIPAAPGNYYELPDGTVCKDN